MAERAREKHLPALDGLRGIAALAVVVLHIGEGLHVPRLVPQGYLAVPFFFLLSGFVVALAYEGDLMRRTSAAGYMLVRIERLYPMFLIGLALGVAFVILRALAGTGGFDAGKFAVMLVAAITMIPLPGQFTFVLLPTQWSLSIELWGNLLHHLLRRYMTGPALMAFVALACVAMTIAAVHDGGLKTGWRMGNIAGGLTAFASSYGAGILIFRLWQKDMLPRLAMPAWCVLALFLGTLLIPQRLYTSSDAARDLVCAVLLYPIVLIACLHVELDARSERMAEWLGRLSYPIYITHFFFRSSARVACCCCANGRPNGWWPPRFP